MKATEKEDNFKFNLILTTKDHIKEYTTNPEFCIQQGSCKQEIDSSEFIMNNIDSYIGNSYSIMTPNKELIGICFFRSIEKNVLEFHINIKPKYRGKGFLDTLIRKFNSTNFELIDYIAKNNKIFTTATKDSKLSKLLEIIGFRKTFSNKENNKELYIYDSRI